VDRDLYKEPFYCLYSWLLEADISAHFMFTDGITAVYTVQNSCYHLDDVESDNESLGFVHLKHAMETVGFSSDIQHR